MAKTKLNILITAGGTREFIDPVRFIANASTGRMGYALARAAIKAGHTVTLITAPTTLRPPKEAAVVNVVTSDEMFKAVKGQFEKCDCLIMAAAVSDYKPAASSTTKIKKEQALLTLDLKPTRDILKWAGRNKTKGQTVVGFALEDTDILTNAEKKLKSKRLDMIVANAPAAIGAERSTLHIKTKTTDWQTLPNQTKTTSAKKLLTAIEFQGISQK
ncbi:MAG: phosphopantothenoylcysteine decarboxylase domain-containing protein [Planctomycetota bacterium]|jgi:phosphopantothenoylcysteine decarboxylase/phosphopantothenate--cysteine ligase